LHIELHGIGENVHQKYLPNNLLILGAIYLKKCSGDFFCLSFSAFWLMNAKSKLLKNVFL
jgi:hypothetical protein